ncbi:PH domain-containing protein [Streptomyces ovatisporus]|uniref:PH domain-containing protein n=1 Tax=Streptomyces ovatisporus TaxID=1128682 RepID=A0ABV9A9I7_9ACTN
MTTGTGRPGQAPGHGQGHEQRSGGGSGQVPESAPEKALDGHAAGEQWNGVERALLKVRRLVLLLTMLPTALGLAALLGLTAGPSWAAFALLPLAGAAWGWGAMERNWRSWRYAEREDDLLISRGVLWRELTVVPYGRMQLVEVTSGPLERRYGLARLQLHTAAATTDATIPGLVPHEAERLRDRLTELGGARSAGL